MADLARRLRRLVSATDSASDADLLDRFVTDRDGLAFAALVSRHGPMVLAVCRRVLRHRQDAEDAFQATFLVLARRAQAVKPRSLLGNWLYGVAYRTALAARRLVLVRRTRETKAVMMRVEHTPDDGVSLELREALDRELAALPNVYRAAVVTCDLEGLSRREAAVRLGWTEGTLSSRLARGRALLARRLSRFGLVVPAAGLAAVSASGAVASELTEATVRLGTLALAGEAVVAAPVAALMEGAMGTMMLTKFKVLAAALVVGCAVAVTAVAGWRADAAGTGAAEPKGTDAPKRAAPNPDKERIAELERERERLLKELAELKDRLAKVEAEQRARAKERALAEMLDRNANRTPDAVPKTPVPGSNLPSLEYPIPVPKSPDAFDPAPKGASSPRPPQDPARSGPKMGSAPNQPSGVASGASVRVYSVGDLAGDEKEGEALAKVVRATVEPKSWGVDAGVEYLPGRKVLVVRQTENAHKEVAELLKLLQTPGSRPMPAQGK
jgi:RNA polymerase sigma factor (sigma-70 family)